MAAAWNKYALQEANAHPETFWSCRSTLYPAGVAWGHHEKKNYIWSSNVTPPSLKSRTFCEKSHQNHVSYERGVLVFEAITVFAICTVTRRVLDSFLLSFWNLTFPFLASFRGTYWFGVRKKGQNISPAFLTMNVTVNFSHTFLLVMHFLPLFVCALLGNANEHTGISFLVFLYAANKRRRKIGRVLLFVIKTNSSSSNFTQVDVMLMFLLICSLSRRCEKKKKTIFVLRLFIILQGCSGNLICLSYKCYF